MSGLEVNSPMKDTETFKIEHCSGTGGDYNFYRVLDVTRNSFLEPSFILINVYLNSCEVKNLAKAFSFLFRTPGCVFWGGSSTEKLGST